MYGVDGLTDWVKHTWWDMGMTGKLCGLFAFEEVI